jgi:hypothetical protein
MSRKSAHKRFRDKIIKALEKTKLGIYPIVELNILRNQNPKRFDEIYEELMKESKSETQTSTN